MRRPPASRSPERGFGRRNPQIRHSETIMAVDQVGSKQWMSFGVARPHTVGIPMRDAVRQDETPPAATGAVDDEADQRCAPRFTLLIRAAKILSPTGEFLCVVRDASETGVSVRLFHPLPPDVPLTLEMPNGDCLPLERVWETEGKAGFRQQVARGQARRPRADDRHVDRDLAADFRASAVHGPPVRRPGEE